MVCKSTATILAFGPLKNTVYIILIDIAQFLSKDIAKYKNKLSNVFAVAFFT